MVKKKQQAKFIMNRLKKNKELHKVENIKEAEPNKHCKLDLITGKGKKLGKKGQNCNRMWTWNMF